MEANGSGRLIAVEGLDGSGKSTQVGLLKEWLEQTGHRVFFSEWNSSVLVKQATRKGKRRNLLTPTTFSLIHATDLADRYERQMLPLLRAGYIVLADRYIYTAFARDVVRGIPPDWVHSLYSFARHPDITLYFRTPLQVALDRILEGRPQLKYHEAGMDLGLAEDPVESFRIFQGLIDAEYEKMIGEYHLTVVDATQPAEHQQRLVRQIISEQIHLPAYRWRRAR